MLGTRATDLSQDIWLPLTPHPKLAGGVGNPRQHILPLCNPRRRSCCCRCWASGRAAPPGPSHLRGCRRRRLWRSVPRPGEWHTPPVAAPAAGHHKPRLLLLTLAATCTAHGSCSICTSRQMLTPTCPAPPARSDVIDESTGAAQPWLTSRGPWNQVQARQLYELCSHGPAEQLCAE